MKGLDVAHNTIPAARKDSKHPMKPTQGEAIAQQSGSKSKAGTQKPPDAEGKGTKKDKKVRILAP